MSAPKFDLAVVCEYIVKSLCADGSTCRELLELPSYCLELILRPPIICPQSSAKLITYIGKRAQDEDALNQDILPSEKLRIGSRRDALLSKCPESNLRSLASLAATLQRSDEALTSKNEIECADSTFRRFSSKAADDTILEFRKQFHTLDSADLKKEESNGLNETALSIQLKSNEKNAFAELKKHARSEEDRLTPNPFPSNKIPGRRCNSEMPTPPPSEIASKEFGNGISLTKKRKLAIMDTGDNGAVESSP